MKNQALHTWRDIIIDRCTLSVTKNTIITKQNIYVITACVHIQLYI